MSLGCCSRKPKCAILPDLPTPLDFFLEDDHVPRTGRLQLREAVLPVDLDGPEHLPIELRGSIDVANSQRDVRQAECFWIMKSRVDSAATSASSRARFFPSHLR